MLSVRRIVSRKSWFVLLAVVHSVVVVCRHLGCAARTCEWVGLTFRGLIQAWILLPCIYNPLIVHAGGESLGAHAEQGQSTEPLHSE